MKILETQVEIAAPASRVWQILTDFAAYPDWNPFIVKAGGELREGGRLALTMQPPGRKAMNFAPRVLKAQANRELRWLGNLWVRGLFDGEHYFIIEELGPERARLTHGERFGGILVPLLKGMLDGPTRQGFEQLNQALKARAEQGGGEPAASSPPAGGRNPEIAAW